MAYGFFAGAGAAVEAAVGFVVVAGLAAVSDFSFSCFVDSTLPVFASTCTSVMPDLPGTVMS